MHLDPSIMYRLLLAVACGAVVGVERELRHKPAGLRTIMFMCFGSALFTILSDEVAHVYGGDHTRIAAQLIPGIGFIGAGSIIHARGSVTGLTTAATIFVMASIGMAAGGGLYAVAVFSTLVILFALSLLGWAERRFSPRAAVMTYRISCPDLDHMLTAVNQILDREHLAMQRLQCTREAGNYSIEFDLDITYRLGQDLLRRFAQIEKICDISQAAVPEKE